ncbi:MAG: ABC transporter substrate-binding protein [Clostridia bacterium]|nr:ABC transporter substrate-binding protein [Clostridia bacterium]
MKRVIAILLTLMIVIGAAACAPADDTVARVITLKGPTGMGMVYLMDSEDYTVELTNMPDDIVGKLATGEADIAALPINLASTLYGRLNGDLVMIAVNTLGVLSVIENGDTIQSIADLEGRKVYATGQGSTPEYIISYLLDAAGVNADVEYVSEHAELATMLATGMADVGILPEPNVSVALGANEELRIALSLTQEWEDVCDATLVQGCIVVRREFLEAHGSVVEAFLEDYKASVASVNSDVATAAAFISDKGIVANKEAAQRAIPNSNIVCITGDEMRVMAEAMLNVLYAVEPRSVGGELPGEDFYFVP